MLWSHQQAWIYYDLHVHMEPVGHREYRLHALQDLVYSSVCPVHFLGYRSLIHKQLNMDRLTVLYIFRPINEALFEFIPVVPQFRRLDIVLVAKLIDIYLHWIFCIFDQIFNSWKWIIGVLPVKRWIVKSRISRLWLILFPPVLWAVQLPISWLFLCLVRRTFRHLLSRLPILFENRIKFLSDVCIIDEESCFMHLL